MEFLTVWIVVLTYSQLDRCSASSPLCFWEFNNDRVADENRQPYIARELQQGTTPLVKRMGGKATRDFTNFHHPKIVDADYLGPRAIIDGRFKLVLHERPKGDLRELFDLTADPAEKTNLVDEHREIADQLHAKLRDWQHSVLRSLTEADYDR